MGQYRIEAREKMDIQLQELIEKIKKDGIESAGEEASKIKSQAQTEAKKIIEEARKQAEDIIARGKADAERTERAGIAAVEQASRNTILAFKDEVQRLLDRIVARDTAAALNDDLLKSLIPELLKNWTAGEGRPVDALLSQDSFSRLESHFRAALSAELKKGVELKPGRGVTTGFRIAEKDGSAYYDFSAETVAGFFSAYLNPQLGKALKDSAKGI